MPAIQRTFYSSSYRKLKFRKCSKTCDSGFLSHGKVYFRKRLSIQTLLCVCYGPFIVFSMAVSNQGFTKFFKGFKSFLGFTDFVRFLKFIFCKSAFSCSLPTA